MVSWSFRIILRPVLRCLEDAEINSFIAMKLTNLRALVVRLPVTATVLIAACWWIVATLMTLAPAWQQLELKLLDKLIVTSAPNKTNLPITIVGIDAESIAKLGLQLPWPRDLYAELLEKLTADGAILVAFDVLFAEPSALGQKDDQSFAQAIRKASGVVLVADRIYRETATTSQFQRVDPLPMFLEAGAEIGLGLVPLDPDLVARQVPVSSDSFWRSVVLRLMRDHPELTPNLALEPGQYIRYVGGNRTFQYVSFHEVIDAPSPIPQGFFKDQMVLVGFAGKASATAQSAQADLFHTPFLAGTGGLMPGVELHANLIETSLNRTAIAAVPQGVVALLLALAAIACARAMRNWRPIQSALWSTFIAAAVGALAWESMTRWNLWLPSASVLTLIAMLYISLGGRSYLLEQARRAEITRAFSLYVTPQVVAHMIAHPEQMKLGGERRNITTLFTDLAGFTSVSEAYSPEKVAQLLNRHFTAMTDIVLEHHGTVVTFIGDAIMAFWGAPLDDEAQAHRCVAAAIAMQRGMQAMRSDFAKEGLPPIHMRVGIHSGSAVVGNLGSAKRFDYTAIGDDVNLAARLEGANKRYGTEILVSGQTVERVGAAIRFRPIDRVIVKGKSVAVEVFTPCDDAQLIDWTTQAMALFRTQQWDAASAILEELLLVHPDDTVAALYMQRIAMYRKTPPGEKWDASVELEK